jgi:hypothetical protein
MKATNPNPAVEEAVVRMKAHDALATLDPIARAAGEDLLASINDAAAIPAGLRYARALHLEIVAHDEWVGAGTPLTHKHSNGTMGQHPLHVAAIATARHARDMAKAAGVWVNGAAWRRSGAAAATPVYVGGLDEMYVDVDE